MSDNYELTYEVVRMHNWAENYWLAEDDECPNRERALLVRGVPMVGDRVEYYPDKGVVVGHEVRPIVRWEEWGENPIRAEDLRPDPSREDAEVEAVARALEDACDTMLTGTKHLARAAIAALDEVRGGEG